jgi:alpha-galactosidase
VPGPTRRLEAGSQSIGSVRGASGHQHNPFLALKRPSTTEESGEAYGLSLVYSGNFLAEAEVDQFQTTRLRIGINPEGFSWALEPGAEFCTPEAVLVYSRPASGRSPMRITVSTAIGLRAASGATPRGRS